MILPVLLAQIAQRWAHRPTAPVHGWTPTESETDMNTQAPLTRERIEDARAAWNHDMSQWGGEYGLELIKEVERLQAQTAVDDAMVERAARAMCYQDNPTAGEDGWSHEPEFARESWRDAARIALTAALAAGDEETS